ncbi:hypothetical protein VPH35_023008 [Triticum aestivum]
MVLETPPSQLCGGCAPPLSGWLDCFKAREGTARGESVHSSASSRERHAPWQLVRSRGHRHQAAAPPPPSPPIRQRTGISDWLLNRCFHCLLPRHRARHCKNPITCRRCFLSGHSARECTNRPAPHRRPSFYSGRSRPAVRAPAGPSRTPPAPPACASTTPPPGHAMAWNGDHRSRPAVGSAVLHATPATRQEALVLATSALLTWFDRELRATKEVITAAFNKLTGALHAERERVCHPAATPRDDRDDDDDRRHREDPGHQGQDDSRSNRGGATGCAVAHLERQRTVPATWTVATTKAAVMSIVSATGVTWCNGTLCRSCCFAALAQTVL